MVVFIEVDYSALAGRLCFVCPSAILERLGLSGMSGEQFFFLLLAVGFALMVVISKFRSRRQTPKESGPAYISRRDNPFKEGYRRYSEAERLEWERKAQLENLARKSEAVDALCRALLSLGIDHKREEKVKAFGRTYFIDVWCPRLRLAFEADGAHHRLTRPSDRRRDEAIRQTLNCKICRRWNRWYLTGDLKRKILIIIAEDEKHALS